MKSQQSTLSTPPEPGARDRLLNVAAHLFTQKGYAATSVQEIVQAARVAKPVLYYYFKSKEGLYLTILNDAYGTFEDILEHTLAFPGTAWQRIVHFTHSMYNLFVEKIAVARLIHSVYYGPPQGAPFFDFEHLQRRYLETLQQIVKSGLESGELRGGTVEDIARAIAGLFEVVTDMELVHPEQGIGREGLSRLLTLLRDGIGAKAGKGKERKP